MDPNAILAALSLAVAFIAVYTDIRSRIIPNALTYTATVIGVVSHICLGIYLSNPFVCARGILGFGLAFIIGYALWLSGGWAGGDVKLFAAFGAILPAYSPPFSAAPYSTEYPFFPITVLINTALVSLPAILVYAGICLARGEGAFHMTVRITELKEGMIPAEWIYEDNGQIHRKLSIISLRSRKAFTSPNRASGLTRAQITQLKRLVREGKIEDRIRIKRGIPFGPFLAAGLAVSVLYGDVYWKILTML
jgi:hypothetical protein